MHTLWLYMAVLKILLKFKIFGNVVVKPLLTIYIRNDASQIECTDL